MLTCPSRLIAGSKPEGTLERYHEGFSPYDLQPGCGCMRRTVNGHITSFAWRPPRGAAEHARGAWHGIETYSRARPRGGRHKGAGRVPHVDFLDSVGDLLLLEHHPDLWHVHPAKFEAQRRRTRNARGESGYSMPQVLPLFFNLVSKQLARWNRGGARGWSTLASPSTQRQAKQIRIASTVQVNTTELHSASLLTSELQRRFRTITTYTRSGSRES